MDLSQAFEQAAKDSKELNSKPTNEILLQLYSLYKQGTIGDVNSEPPSNPFDFVARAKFEAWTELKGKPKEEAMKDYIALVEELKANG
jgi:diazepam-binding inhibitor (GABA receptor modulating acyl-CoA-binding protein)